MSAIDDLLRRFLRPVRRGGDPIDRDPPSSAEAVRRAMEAALDCPVASLSSEQLRAEKTERSLRQVAPVFMRHVLRAGAPPGRELVVFTKIGRKVASEELERYLSALALPEFRTPHYYGHVVTAEGETGIWEYVSAEQQRLRKLPREDLLRIARAAAAVNALTADIVGHMPALPVGTKDARPVVEVLRAALAEDERTMQRFPSWGEALDRMAALEAPALVRIASIGNRFFSHQDISRGNVLFTPAPEPLVILDWESAAIAAPGASLHRLAALDADTQAEIARHYVDYLASKGLSADVGDVLFVMGAVQVFNKLHDGARFLRAEPRRARQAIRWGLAHAPDYLRR